MVTVGSNSNDVRNVEWWTNWQRDAECHVSCLDHDRFGPGALRERSIVQFQCGCDAETAPVGSRASPWVWEGVMRLANIHGRWVVGVGETQDVEQALYAEAFALNISKLLVRAIVVGRDAPRVSARVQKEGVECCMRGQVWWELAQFVGHVASAGRRVRIEAWEKGGEVDSFEESSGVKQKDGQALADALVAHVTSLRAGSRFQLKQVLGRKVTPQENKHLTAAARVLMNRGILRMELEQKRRIFSRLPDPSSMPVVFTSVPVQDA